MQNAIASHKLRNRRIGEPASKIPAEARSRPTVVKASVDDAALAIEVRRIVGGDASALSALYDSTVARLYSLAGSVLRCRLDAEEVVGDVFVFVWRNAQRYDSERGGVMAWLSIITRSRSIDRLRKRRASPSWDGAHRSQWAGFPAIDLETTDDCLRQFEADSRVSRALASQSPVRRTLIALAFFDGLCHEEIARATGLPLGSVKSHIRRSLKSMRTKLDVGPVPAAASIKLVP